MDPGYESVTFLDSESHEDHHLQILHSRSNSFAYIAVLRLYSNTEWSLLYTWELLRQHVLEKQLKQVYWKSSIHRSPCDLLKTRRVHLVGYSTWARICIVSPPWFWAQAKLYRNCAAV